MLFISLSPFTTAFFVRTGALLIPLCKRFMLQHITSLIPQAPVRPPAVLFFARLRAYEAADLAHHLSIIIQRRAPNPCPGDTLLPCSRTPRKDFISYSQEASNANLQL